MRLMIVEYKLKQFKKEFNSKPRELEENHEKKFKTLKKELLKWLEQFNVDLHVFPDLEFTLENYTLFMSYTEVTGSKMKISFSWKINQVDEDDIIDYVINFCEVLEVEPPVVSITKESMNQFYGMYFPNDKTLTFSLEFATHNPIELVKSVLRHEILHHYCYIKGLGAKDTDPDFINLLIKYDAYISMEPNAQAAYKLFIARLEEYGSGFHSGTFSEARLKILVMRWNLKHEVQSWDDSTIVPTFNLGA